ncbi:transmembrane protein 6/97 [Rhodocollybia butyracea]|uniref:Efficient mitochondria targeting-associated protein 19 n=1 Tax=Rhodocollybia butyracea TaxID=206335 RepID=A0A9P5PVE6_9AGAR|nr:transmembrane protein 6/97 [Rhodocollybia butyracea]
MARISLTSRPLDLVYFCFFLTHIPASLVLDFQMLYPASYIPSFLPKLQNLYIEFSGDPLIAGAARGDLNGELVWLWCFAWLEMLFQFPTFFLGIRGLWNNSRSIYVLILAYGASTATTTLPCIFFVLRESAAGNITAAQLLILLSSYIPFFVIPLIMAIDMGFRIHNIIAAGEAKQKHE